METASETDADTGQIEVLLTAGHYVLVRGEHSLWWRRGSGDVSAGSPADVAAAADAVCVGVCDALLGRLQTEAGGRRLLLLARQSRPAGQLPSGHTVRRLTHVTWLPLTAAPPPDTSQCQLNGCRRHQPAAACPTAAPGRAGLARTWGIVRHVTTRVTAATSAAAAQAGAQVKERVPGLSASAAASTAASIAASIAASAAASTVLDEVLKLLGDGESFYFCPGGDITNSMQRQLDGAAVDERFFWNWAMLEPVRALSEPAAALWSEPLLQGYVSIADVGRPPPADPAADADAAAPAALRLSLISRRSRHRAGTRYRRRGVDADGNVANYAETEQVLSCGGHHLAVVLVRGSVPVFWAQPGHRYRPPPRLERDAAETAVAFRRHVEAELTRFDRLHCVSLADQTGRERVVSDAYLDHVLTLDSDRVYYTAFDFHDHCRGLRLDKVSLLLAAVAADLRAAGFAWADRRGLLCRQTAVFRVSCIDCLDRTNVVQTALARDVLTAQLAKLGVTADAAPPALAAQFRRMWADTGDVLSRQYAGTGALKADFTRTGERRWTGLMRDGVNSANRYYLNRFRDAGRQAAIDATLGRPPPAEPADEPDESDEPDEASDGERVRQLLADCQRLLVPDEAAVLGSWPLVDAEAGGADAADDELDTVLVLTSDSYYVACYDDAADRVVSYQRVPLADVLSLQLGPLDAPRLSRAARPTCLRLCYQIGGERGFFHQVRAAPVQLFNNTPVAAGSSEQRLETLRALAAALLATCEADGHQVALSESRLDRRRSRASLAGSRRGWPDEGADLTTRAVGWLPRLWEARAAVAPRSVTQRNSPETDVACDGGGVSGDDLLVDSAGIIACRSADAAAAAGLPLSLPLTSDTSPAPCATADTRSPADASHQPTAAAGGHGNQLSADWAADGPGGGAARPSAGLTLFSSLSPLASPARDTVLEGFSRLARGVQRLGAAAPAASDRRRQQVSELLRQRIAASKSHVTIL